MDFKLFFQDKRGTNDLRFKWKEDDEVVAHFGNFAVVMTQHGSVLVLPDHMRETVLGMTPGQDRVITPIYTDSDEAYEKAFTSLRDLSFEYYSKSDIKNIKLQPSPPRGPEEHVKDRAIMSAHDMAHQVADCQFQDGSVLVEWQGVEGEGTKEAEVGQYRSLGEALASCPTAAPVCFNCEPQLAENGQDTQHREGCSYATDGSESALSP